MSLSDLIQGRDEMCLSGMLSMASLPGVLRCCGRRGRLGIFTCPSSVVGKMFLFLFHRCEMLVPWSIVAISDVIEQIQTKSDWNVGTTVLECDVHYQQCENPFPKFPK